MEEAKAKIPVSFVPHSSEGHRTVPFMVKEGYDQITRRIIGAAIEVHKQLGCGLLESIYANCLVKELRSPGLIVQQEVPLPIRYKGDLLEKDFFIDLLVENDIILELKAVESVIPLHKAQLLSLLRLSGTRVGLLINFDVPILKHGIHRVVNGWVEQKRSCTYENCTCYGSVLLIPKILPR